MTGRRTFSCFSPALLFVFVASLLCLAPRVSAQRGAITIQQNLATLVDEAAVIIRGRIIASRVEPHPEFQNLQTIVITVAVDHALKGSPGQVYTFRQFLWDVRDKYDVASHKKAQNVLLLLNKPSQYGLSMPVGLGQGRFLIYRQADGDLAAVNAFANVGLFQNFEQEMRRRGKALPPHLVSQARQFRSGPLKLADLEDFIRAAQAGN